MRYMFHLICKNLTKNSKLVTTKHKIVSKKNVVSYGKFLRDNPNHNKKQRLDAIKNFLDSTR